MDLRRKEHGYNEVAETKGHPVLQIPSEVLNDAPALRQAEVGIAVSTATDVAKGAASVVLTEPGLTNIVTLVEQGRTIYQRILTWIINKISRTTLKADFRGDRVCGDRQVRRLRLCDAAADL